MLSCSRNTVNVVNTHYHQVHNYSPAYPIPRRSENVVELHHTKPILEPLPSINENSFCDGLTEISGGVYTDNDLSEVIGYRRFQHREVLKFT